MTMDQKKVYMVSAALVPAFLLVCFVTNAIMRRFGLLVVVGAALVAVYALVKKRTALSLQKRQMLWVLPTFGFLGVTLLYMTGVSFGFYRVIINTRILAHQVLPIAGIIAVGELVRARLLMQRKSFVNGMTFCAFVLCDIAMLYQRLPLAGFQPFVDFFGDIVFPCVASGLLYHHVSKRYGAWPVILYRLLMTLYSVVLPLYPAVPDALLSFFKVSFPALAILFVSVLYERKQKSFARKRAVLQAVTSVLSIVLMTGFMALISCQFRYGMMVVATESMTGSIDKGDAIIYERYENQPIQEGQVLVFEKNKTVYIHRVISIESIDGQLRYYTKGDANDDKDTGFITNENIVGLTDITIKHIGQPTLWVRELFLHT